MKAILKYTGIVVCLVFIQQIHAQASPDAFTSIKTDHAGFTTITDRPDSTFGDFTEITPPDPLFITPPDEDFWVIATAPGDYDNDGDIDIATLGYYVVYNTSVDERLVLMRNDGPSGPEEWDFFYTEVPLGSLTTGASDMAWGDADSDGDLDLVVGTDGTTVIYRNDSGTLVLTTTFLPGYWEDNSQADFDLRSITWVDFDNDGDQDLLIPSAWDDVSAEYKTVLMRNDSQGGSGGLVFSEVNSSLAPTEHAQSCWADCDTDGDLDLLLINVSPVMDNGFIRRYKNDGNGSFTGEDILGSLSIEHGEAQWGDYDGDGDLDILVAGNLKELNGSYTPLSLRIYRNDNETYTGFEVVPDPYSEGWFDFTAATWADYDSDGDMDILVAGNYNSGANIEGRARIYSNNNGLFTDSGNELPAPRAAGDRGGTFSWLDIDGEGDLDYFIAGQYFVPGGNGLVEAQMHLYRNDVAGLNLAPSSPGGVIFNQLSDTTASLSWLPSTDDHTPGEALTYELNLFHGNEPVGLPLHCPEPGNLSAVTEWFLSGLEPGEYTWHLSAVDAAYTSSPRASGSFSMVMTSFGELPSISTGDLILEQNFPNPFSQETTIRYITLSDGFVSLILYNSQGKIVTNLVNEVQTAGSYKIMMNDADLADGIYYYRLKSGISSLTRKLVVSGGSGNK